MQAPVSIKKLHPDAIIPQYQTAGAAGCDIHSVEDAVIQPGHTMMIHTGIAIEVPPGLECQCRPRSGLAAKRGITVLNAPGTIDSDYRGECNVILHNTSRFPFEIAVGDRIAQLVFAPVFQAVFAETDELSSTDRGERGFGSTGVKS